MSETSCRTINHPNIAPGWACHCGQYNGDHFSECKNCKHERCDGYERQPIDDIILKAIQNGELDEASSLMMIKLMID